MSRHGFSDDGEQWQYIMWQGQLASAVRGKRGQEFLKDLISALDAMPEKKLIHGELRKDGEICALGALGAKRGIALESIDPEDYEIVACAFNIATQLAREVAYQNDEGIPYSSLPEKRWQFMRDWAQSKVKQ